MQLMESGTAPGGSKSSAKHTKNILAGLTKEGSSRLEDNSID